MEGEQSIKISTLRTHSSEEQARIAAKFAAMRAEADARTAQLPKIRTAGREALMRLMPIAQRDTGQSGVVARFLLSLYNGDRFPFDLSDFRRLDGQVFDDCIAVLKMDSQPAAEVHTYFNDGGKLFENLAADWGFKDYGCGDWK